MTAQEQRLPLMVYVERPAHGGGSEVPRFWLRRSAWELRVAQLPGLFSGLRAQQLSGTVCPSLNEPDALHVKSVWPP